MEKSEVKKKSKNPTKNQSQFYEHLPGAYASPEMFQTKVDYTEADDEVLLHRNLLRQLAILSGLLILQIILFIVLVNSTINLG